jgi:hypothetical protein
LANIVQTSAYNWEITFETLEEWMIPMIHVMPIFSIDDGYNLGYESGDVLWGCNFNYIWEKVGESSYKLYLRLFANAGMIGEYTQVTLYTDLNLWITNDRFFNSNQHNAGA